MVSKPVIFNNKMADPEVWGPRYWFVLHSIALTYPLRPNDITKKKYYEFIENLHLFLPHTEIGAQFSTFLKEYPVTPYLDSRESFMKWMHFIHNRINLSLGKPTVSYEKSIQLYLENYVRDPDKERKEREERKKLIYGVVISAFLSLSVYLYFKK